MSNFSVDLLADEFAALYAEDNTHFPPQWAVPDEYRTTRDKVLFNTGEETSADPKKPGESGDSFDESFEAGNQEEYLTTAATSAEVKEDGDAGNGVLANHEPDMSKKRQAESGEPEIKPGESQTQTGPTCVQ